MNGTLLRLLRLAAPFKWWMALSAFLGFATVASGIGLMSAAAFIIASAALHPSIADLSLAIVGVRFFGISRGVFRYLERYVSHTVTFRLLARIRVWFYSALEPLAPARMLQHRSGDLFTRAVADVETLQHFFVRVIAPPFVALLVTLGAGLFVWGFSARLALVLLAFLVAAGAGVPLATLHASTRSGRKSTTARAQLNVAVVDGVQGMADLLAFGQESRQMDQVRGLAHEWAGAQEGVARTGALQTGLVTLLTNLSMWAVLVVAIPLVSAGQLSGVSLAVLILAALASFEAVAPLSLAVQHLGSCLQAARRLFEIVDCPAPVVDPAGEVPARPAAQGSDLTVNNLSFRYGQEEGLILDRVSFDLRKGTRLAIVGPSGAGKSTLVNVLLRFWEYQDGSIVLGGRGLRECPQDDVRRMIAVVSQRTHLFNTTIRENLLIARPGASEQEMILASQRARLHDFVQTLPHGYDTMVGELGMSLSGGERQRVAIARALLKDAPILILDEATANLDSLTERHVMGSIVDLMSGRTTLVVTHRLVGLEEMDEILVLSAGRVVERGRHHELLQIDGLYRRMWNLQRQALVMDHLADSDILSPAE